MRLIDTAQHKNITCNVYADNISKDGIYRDGINFVTFERHYTAFRECLGVYSSPSHNKRSKNVVIELKLKASSKAELDGFVRSENAWLERQYKKMGAANKGKAQIFTMLRNKGY